MTQENKPSETFYWINKMFPNKMVRLALTCMVLLFTFYTLTPKEYKIGILVLVVVLIVIAVIFQYKAENDDNQKIKMLQRELTKQKSVFQKQKNKQKDIAKIEEEKELIKEYVSLNDKLKKLFVEFFLLNNLYVEIKKDSIRIRNVVEREIDMKNFPVGGFFSMSARVDEKLAEMNYLIQKGLVTKIMNEKDAPYDFRLELTRKGRILKEIISKLNIGED